MTQAPATNPIVRPAEPPRVEQPKAEKNAAKKAEKKEKPKDIR
jgi:hypothetical protein